MENMTGLLVALMFVTLLTIGFGNILGAIAPRLKSPRDLMHNPLQSVWWVILALVVLDTFWRCTAIFSVEIWSFAEFLYVLLGSVLLFFASTALPSDDLPDKNRVFFACLAGFQIWLLGLSVLFGMPGPVALLGTLLMLLVLIAILMRPTMTVYKSATTAMAVLTLLSLFQ